MFSLKNAKLRDRILFGYSLPILLSLGAATLVFFKSHEVLTKANILSKANLTVRDLKNIEIGFAGMQKSARGYFLAGEASFISEYDESVKKFDKFYAELQSLIQDPAQQANLEKIGELQNQIDDLYRRVFVLIGQNKRVEGMNLWKTEIVPKLRQVEEIAKDFESIETQVLTTRSQEQNEALQLLTVAVIASTAIASTLGIGIALWIASGISQTMSQTANVIASSSTEIAATVEQHERTAAQQAASVSQTTTTIDELGVSSRASAEQAEAAAAGARQVLALIDNSIESEQATVAGQSSLREKVAEISEQILHLSEQTDQISSISNVVSELANQTNMLALNAAVEAVRAGEHGKGFGVVANEIRKLADQSRKSAEKINTLVSDIQKAMNSTVIVTNEGNKTVASIVTAVNNIAINSQQISLTAKQQAIAVQQVVGAMNELNQGAVQTASGITQTKVSTQQLHTAAQNLKAVV